MRAAVRGDEIQEARVRLHLERFGRRRRLIRPDRFRKTPGNFGEERGPFTGERAIALQVVPIEDTAKPAVAVVFGERERLRQAVGDGGQ